MILTVTGSTFSENARIPHEGLLSERRERANIVVVRLSRITDVSLPWQPPKSCTSSSARAVELLRHALGLFRGYY